VARRLVLLPALCLLALSTVASAGAATSLPGIRSPTGNIACLLLPSPSRVLLCTVDHADYAVRLQARCLGPAGAGVDWHGFTLSPTGKGLRNCSGGSQYNPATQQPSFVTLAYGTTRRIGSFTCASSRDGLTCRNRRGHGLFLSLQAWRAW
jgi:hypothetical protein